MPATFYAKILATVLVSQMALADTLSDIPIVIAVIDTGLDLKNSVLTKDLWTNPGESGLDAKGRDKSSNGIDDDKNGYIDDVHGWDFVRNTSLPFDEHGHGTHVTGLILSQTKDSAPTVRIMILKYYSQKFAATDTLKNTVLALEYAMRMGAQIINYSGGGYDGNSQEKALIEKAGQRGILLVAASGNEGTDLSRQKFFPASYALQNILSVTAVDNEDRLLSTSNFSSQFVHLAASGKNLTSWLPGHKQGQMTGTSQATALVTGAAARLIIERPELREQPRQVIRLLQAEATDSMSLEGKVQFAGLLAEDRHHPFWDQGTTPFGQRLAPGLSNSDVQFFSDKN